MHQLTEAKCLLAFAIAVACAGCGSSQSSNIQPEYDPKTGRLQLLKYDSNGNGIADTWSYMDGTQVLRIEIDQDEDGKMDRWEYYGAGQKLERIGTSRANDGKEDAWTYSAPDGSTVRIDVSTGRDGKVTRTEYYEQKALVRVEEDSDLDGKMDKWETYDAGRLTSVAYDTLHRGTPDRRLVYGADGSAHLEVDAEGSGQFVTVSVPPVRRTD
jgi:hypothetical protein